MDRAPDPTVTQLQQYNSAPDGDFTPKIVLRENCPLIPIQKVYSCSWASETGPTTRARQQSALKPIIQRDGGGVKRENTSIRTCCCRVT